MFCYKSTRSWPEAPVPLVLREEVATLYSFGHDDGPRTGLVRWKEELYYASDFCLSEDGLRCYWLVRLTSEQQAYALSYGETWRAFFTGAMSWTPDGERVETEPGPYAVEELRGCFSHTQEGRDKFSALFPKRPEPDESAEVCGYFMGWTL